MKQKIHGKSNQTRTNKHTGRKQTRIINRGRMDHPVLNLDTSPQVVTRRRAHKLALHLKRATPTCLHFTRWTCKATWHHATSLNPQSKSSRNLPGPSGPQSKRNLGTSFLTSFQNPSRTFRNCNQIKTTKLPQRDPNQLMDYCLLWDFGLGNYSDTSDPSPPPPASLVSGSSLAYVFGLIGFIVLIGLKGVLDLGIYMLPSPIPPLRWPHSFHGPTC